MLQPISVPAQNQIPFIKIARKWDAEPLTLAWADSREQERVIVLAVRAGRQTMNLRRMPGAKLVVLRRSDGQFAGWAGMDVESDPQRPELFSQFVYPEFRGVGLGSLLEHVWWAYLDSRGYSTGFMRMELDTNEPLFQKRLGSGYYRQMSEEDLGPRFVGACRNCELFGHVCHRQVFLAVDVQKALVASIQSWGPLRISSLPIRIVMEPEHSASIHATREADTLSIS